MQDKKNLMIKKESVLVSIMAFLSIALIAFSLAVDVFFPAPETGLTVYDIPEQSSFINTSSGSNPGAPIDLIVFTDFSCSFCRQTHPELMRIMEDYGDSVNLVIRHLPRNDFSAAAASECARDQGRFMEFYDALFTTDKQASTIARSLELDMNKFNSCIESGRKIEVIQQHVQEARANNIDATPVFIINREMLIGSQDYDSLEQAIKDQLDPEKITEEILS